MHICLRVILSVALLDMGTGAGFAQNKSAPKGGRAAEAMEAATRLQVYLDRAEFAPGKIDGHYGDFTRKALALYRESRGEKSETPPADANSRTAPDMAGLDLASVDPVFITYTVTDEALAQTGELPEAVEEQAKLKALPYRSAVEAVAEKFHADCDFLEELNPGRTKDLKAGDKLKVPNVEPFELGTVKDMKPGSEVAAAGAANETDQGESDAPKTSGEPGGAAPPVAVFVDTKTNMAVIRVAEKIVAAYPVTIGSTQTESPIGDWKVRGIARLPTFRYDEQMLQHGERSSDFHMLPPGPNSPVGVMWIALNKKGIGLHGTRDPDEIGRSASHGCIRLANWDVVRLAAKVRPGVPVAIH